MIVYLNCYVWGEGYSTKYMEYPNGTLEEFSIQSGKMPQWQRKVLTSTGARLFYGKIDGQQFGCARMIESGKYDENGRTCYYNIAFADSDENSNLVSAIMAYAKNNYQDFCQDINTVIWYKGVDYRVKEDALVKLYHHAKAAGLQISCSSGCGLLVPEGSEDYFFTNTQLPVEREKIKIIKELNTVSQTNKMHAKQVDTKIDNSKNVESKPEGTMSLFFYCSTPSMGYVMKQIDSNTGEVVSEGKEAGNNMPKDAFALTTRSGACIALYKTIRGECLVVKNIRSVKADQYGRYKHMTIAFEADQEQALMLMQLAAWAMLDFKKFCIALTDCVDVFDGPKGFVVDVSKLQELFACFEKRIRKIRPKYQKIWYKLMMADMNKEYQCLVLEASLDYFNRSTELSVAREQIAIMISDEKMEQWKEDPLSLEFVAEIYQDNTVEAVAADESQDIEKSITEVKQESLELEEMDMTASEAVQDPRGIKGEDYIDLMDKKWFKAALIIGGAVLIAAAVFLIRKFL